MSTLKAIARAELSYLSRSRLALVSSMAFAICLVFASLSSSLFLAQETEHRLSHQENANEIFESQPDRHPHRMVHYGQYVFRTPPALAAIDPGLDAYGGTAMFLEGHRQNAAMFAEATQGAELSRFGSFTPAFVLQVFAPLLLILIAFSSLTREKETGTLKAALAQGVSLRSLASGKALILFAAVCLCLVPLLCVGIGTVFFGGESPLSVFLLVLSYGLYLTIWALTALCISHLVRRGSTSLLILLVLWLASTIVVPRLAADVASQVAQLKTAFERDMELQAALHSLGDAHDLNDPAYLDFQKRVLAQYQVTSMDELPVNLKGLLAVEGERQGAEVLAQFNQANMAARQAQKNWILAASLFSPSIAVHGASQSLAGTDLGAYHRFLMEAEAHRLAFVQDLNMLQATQVDIKLDKIKSIDVSAEQATRISSEAWAALPRFQFKATPIGDRLAASAPHLFSLSLWLGLITTVFFWLTRRAQL